MFSVVAIMLVSLASPQQGVEPWYTHYQRGVELVEAGDGAAAVVELESALEARPEPALRVATDGPRYIDYLPYFQRARIQLGQGEVAAAAHSLEVAEAFGIVMFQRNTRQEFNQLRQQVATQISQNQPSRLNATPRAVATAARLD